MQQSRDPWLKGSKNMLSIKNNGVYSFLNPALCEFSITGHGWNAS